MLCTAERELFNDRFFPLNKVTGSFLFIKDNRVKRELTTDS